MTTKKITLFALAVLLLASMPVLAQRITAPRAASPAAEVAQTIGISKVTINYSRPSVREREIWGNQFSTLRL